MPTTLVWFRNDLRIDDNPALDAAVRAGRAVIPVFIWAPEEEAPWSPGAASRWWLHQSLKALEARLRQVGSRLVVRRGPTTDTLRALVRETGAEAVFWNRRYEPAVIARDTRLKELMRGDGLHVESYNSALLFEPWTVSNKAGRPFQVFSAFWRHCLALAEPGAALPVISELPGPVRWPKSDPLSALGLEPFVDWAGGIRAAWTPGELGAKSRLEQFLASAFAGYTEDRNRPDLPGTSRFSPHLHFGEIGPRQVWQALRDCFGDDRATLRPSRVTSAGADAGGVRPKKSVVRQEARPTAANPAVVWRQSQFVAEIGWREFAHHLLYHFPHTPAEPLRGEFRGFPWRKDTRWLKAWQRGRTGFPIVDAGMRELWATGWMHNRVRMIVASFLVKDLLISWEEGARWFWDTLVDADLANNTLGWQWTAGCGADAAPYFRVFNPVSQGEKFDPRGDYVRRWVPELGRLPGDWVHKPWEAPPLVLRAAGVELGGTYPEPIVNHAIAREVALEAFGKVRK